MKNQTCVLCGLPLSDGKTNREHYVPQVLIRNFEKLGIPKSWTHALRVNKYGALSSSEIIPIERHYDWATIEVHQKCNLDASQMCQDLKWWIDHPDQYPDSEADSRIRAYYGHLWNVDPKNIGLFKSIENLEGYISGLVYNPGKHLQIGWLTVAVYDAAQKENDQYHHTIYLGTKEGLEDCI